MSSGVRIDKWLWAVRLYKTRSVAAAACRHGDVRVNGQLVKPSRDVHMGELIKARTGHLTRTVRVAGLIDKRVSAAVAREHAEDLTPADEYAKRPPVDYSRGVVRPKGAGRPTKKDRRAIERVSEE